MRVLTIGAAGFLGGHFTKWLVEQGHTVTAVSRRPLDKWWQVCPDAFLKNEMPQLIEELRR